MRFIDAARRCGQLQTIVSLLDEAGKKCTGIEERINDESTMAKSGSLEAGFYLCKALYHWYTGIQVRAAYDYTHNILFPL